MSASAEPLTVLLTRTVADCSEWSRELESLGLRAASFPCIECRALDVDLTALETALASHSWLALSSARAVEALAALELNLPSPLPRVACVGERTAAAASQLLDTPALVASEGTAADLGRGLAELLLPGEQVLYLTAREGLMELERQLPPGVVTRIGLYETLPATEIAEPPAHEAVFFASPSAVEGFRRRAQRPLAGIPLVALGPTTARAIEREGWGPVLVAETRSLPGMIEALRQAQGASGETLPNP